MSHYTCSKCEQHYDFCRCGSRVTGKHPALGMPYGSEAAREPSESSSEGSSGPAGGVGAGWPSGTLKLSLQRADGLSVERIIDGEVLERLKWPDIAIRSTFDAMLQDFRRTDRENFR
jgi:hypothetical protein